MDPELLTAFEDAVPGRHRRGLLRVQRGDARPIQAGAVYDVIVPSDYMVGIMVETAC